MVFKAVIGGVFLITIKEDTNLKARIQEAINKAKNLAKAVLVSEVQKLNPLDSLSFFAAGNEHFFGERFYWKDSSENMFIVGLGIAAKLQTDQVTDRFFHVEKEWEKMLEDAIIIGSVHESGVGPTLFGGFSFDPQKEKTGLWANFSDSIFHLPTFMYTEKNGQAYLTTNVVCTQEDDELLASTIEAQRNEILASIEQPFSIRKNKLIIEEEKKRERWKETVDSIVKYLKEHSLKKIVLARETRLTYQYPIQLEQVIHNLLAQQANSFVFAIESGNDCFIGATPERLVKKEGQNMVTDCIAGSIKRGETEKEDEQLGAKLLADQKNLVEHQYVVDMIKEAVEELCEEVVLPAQPRLKKMRDIQHLHTPVTGKIKRSTSLLLLVERLHPTPALGGLPKEEAVVKIRAVEELDRGLYGSPLGWIDYNGNGDFAVSIRSGLIQGNEASIFAGCGVVKDSNVESEYEETKVKFRPMLTALGGKES